MILRGSNEPIALLVSPACLTAKYGSVTLQDGGGVLYQWLRRPAELAEDGSLLQAGRDDIYTMAANETHTVCLCEWSQADTAALPVGPVRITARFLDTAGNVLFSRALYDYVVDRGDTTILGGG